MTGSTKILTVSYGTFSCTLEGFDDPIGSMREMAEYFRDLAADDRYFGAEPPTPDVEMLQRIAEKEVQRRVEARVTGAGVALVAAPAAGPEAAADADDAETDDSEEREARHSGPLAYDDDYTMSDEPEDAFQVDPAAKVESPGPAETVAEKLRRIREVVSRNIEVDQAAARREQAPNAESPGLRNRALSETIQQIQADIDDGDQQTEATLTEASTPLAMETFGGEDMAADGDEWDEEDAFTEAEETSEERKERSLTEMIGSVTGRIKSELQEEHSASKADEEDEADEEDDTLVRTLRPKSEVDVGRLLDETDSKLNENETVRRRRVISQMRAAVAATKADRAVSSQVSREAAEEAEKSRYREDLSDAVEDGPSDDAPEDETDASSPPLVLVSSQRVDSEPVVYADDIRRFAREFGAKELPELMEAAAAFTIFSAGQSSFTRPEIMQMITRMDPSLEMSREDSLRSFGQLLRDGTFKKLERGQFTIDQDTKYNPDQRASAT